MVIDPLKNAGEKVIANLIPPGTPDNKRWKYDATVSAGLLVLGVHMIWACGFLIVFGLHGFVTSDVEANDVSKVQLQIIETARKAEHSRKELERTEKDIQFLLVKNSLKGALKDLCTAERNGNQAALDAANTEIGNLQDQYHALTGWTWQQPPCSIVLVGPQPH